jgi:hypothetical protein
MANNELEGRADDDSVSESNQETAKEQAKIQAGAVPGRRMKNPLGYFSSYTYQLSLYMITPDAYDAFILSGRRQINALRNAEGNLAAGAYLIAQSGGINNEESIRAPGFDLDYYIDNLTIKTYLDPQSTMTASADTEIKFQIMEPYGFSFLTKLKQASDALQGYSRALEGIQNPTRQFFILGVRFLGYDEHGNPMSGSNIYDGSLLDPASITGGIFERFYDINIINIKFKIDGAATVYNVDAVAIAPQVAFGKKRGRINNDTTITGASIQDLLQGPDGLLPRLNKANRDNSLGEDIEPNVIFNEEIRWLGPDADRIKDATIVLPEDWDKTKFPNINAQNTLQVTQAEEDKASPDVARRNVIFKGDTSIQQAISQLISQSSYLQEALTVIYDSVKQPNDNTGNYKQQDTDSPSTKVAWYNLSAEISKAVWNASIGDFTYHVTFIIQTYETPVITNAYTGAGSNYYGPHKRYDYWYTGKNSEILSYEQVINNGYFTVALASDGDKRETLGNPLVPVVSNQQIDQLRLGKLQVGQEAQNTYITSLYDPGSFVSAKITIMGDPDFLVMESPGSINDVYSRFYGTDGYTVTANGGQVFIEIDFKEAVDYDTEKGYLSINDRIMFWKYPEDVPVQGVSYRVLTAQSSFQGGAFKQVLECVINTFGGINGSQQAGSDSDQNQRSEPSNVITLGSREARDASYSRDQSSFTGWTGDVGEVINNRSQSNNVILSLDTIINNLQSGQEN